MFRSTSGTKRAVVLLLALVVPLLFVLPKHSRTWLQSLGQPLAYLFTLPLNAVASLDRGLQEFWSESLALYRVADDNRRLQRENELLQGQVNEWRELALSSRRLAALLALKERMGADTIAARVLGRDATNWYRSVILDKGAEDGVVPEMGVIVPKGVIGRVVKTTPSTAVVLLITDPNNAITGVVQRTRDEGIVEGTVQGRARMKFLPLLSAMQVGDVVVTSGLAGGFPRGLPIGTISHIDKVEGELFQSAELVPAVDFLAFEEVLVITNPRPQEGGQVQGVVPGNSRTPVEAARGARP